MDGSTAISCVRRERPDLIILDINFPADLSRGGGISWDGFLILDWLRRIDEVRDTPIIFITSGEPAKFRDKAMSTGAVAFFKNRSTRTKCSASSAIPSAIRRNRAVHHDDGFLIFSFNAHLSISAWDRRRPAGRIIRNLTNTEQSATVPVGAWIWNSARQNFPRLAFRVVHHAALVVEYHRRAILRLKRLPG